jgi:hypothetical protein
MAAADMRAMFVAAVDLRGIAQSRVNTWNAAHSVGTGLASSKLDV